MWKGRRGLIGLIMFTVLFVIMYQTKLNIPKSIKAFSLKNAEYVFPFIKKYLGTGNATVTFSNWNSLLSKKRNDNRQKI